MLLIGQLNALYIRMVAIHFLLCCVSGVELREWGAGFRNDGLLQVEGLRNLLVEVASLDHADRGQVAFVENVIVVGVFGNEGRVADLHQVIS